MMIAAINIEPVLIAAIIGALVAVIIELKKKNKND